MTTASLEKVATLPTAPQGDSAVTHVQAAPTTWHDRLMIVTATAAGVMAMANCGADPDLWGHVLYGRDALRDGLPAVSTYTYTAVGQPWINHEIIAEYLLAIGDAALGPRGLLIAKLLLSVGLLAGLLRVFARQGATPVLRSLLLILVATNLTFFWILRPQLLSFVYLAGMLALLSWCFADWEGSCRINWGWFGEQSLIAKFVRAWRKFRPVTNDGVESSDTSGPPKYCHRRMRALWLLAPLFCLWTNSHGAFLAGLAILYVYLFCRGLEAWSWRGKESLGLQRRFALMAAAATTATFLNPYSYRLHVWLIESLVPPRPEITEWQPPYLTWELATVAWIPLLLLLAITIASLLFSRRSIDVTHLVIFSLITWQALEHRRHIALVALLFGFWMSRYVVGWFQRLGFGGEANASLESTASPLMRRMLGGLMGASLMVMSLCIAEQLDEVRVLRELYPVSAFQFIEDEQLEGRIVVNFDWAQYLLMAFGAEHPGDRGLRVQFDGRYDTCYPREVVDMHFDFEIGEPCPEARYRGPDSPPVDPSMVLWVGHPELLLLSRHKPHPLQVMADERHASQWTLLYQDSLAQVWGRNDVYDNPEHPKYMPHERRHISDDKQEGIVAWPALPKRKTEPRKQAATRRSLGQPVSHLTPAKVAT